MHTSFKVALDAGYIEPATLPNGQPFIIDGIQYYQPTEGNFSLMMLRFHSCNDTLQRYDNRKVSDELLTTALATMRNQLSTAMAQINNDPEQVLDNLRHALTTVERLTTRRELGLDVSQIYEVASIFFFSQGEDPAAVDAAACKKKIASWTAQPGLFDQLLRLPLNRFVPLSNLLDSEALSQIQDLNLEEYLDWTLMVAKGGDLGLAPETLATITTRLDSLNQYDSTLSALLKKNRISLSPDSARDN